MEIREIIDKDIWDSFIKKQQPDTFLQGWGWGEFNKAMGEKIWRLGFFENDALNLAALIIRIDAKRGSFLFVPHGPIIENEKLITKNEKLFNYFFDCLVTLGKREKVDFIRISPLLENTDENLRIFKNAGFKDAPVHMMHPELTWLLDISKSDDEIMKGMRKTHRNLIRRAEKEGVIVRCDAGKESLKTFYDIHMDTVKRHKFTPFSFDYLTKEVETLKQNDEILIFSAIYGANIISSAIIVFYGKEAFYHHGASSSEYGKIPASYLALWNAIKKAREKGCKTFNFYGIVENKPNHPWSGLSKFKQGFGGYKKNLVHCQDFRMKNKYYINFAIETIRKIKRRYK